MGDFQQDDVRNCVKAYLNANKLTYQDLAERTNLSLQTINNYLSTTKMSRKTVERFSVALDYPLELLLAGQKYYGRDKSPSPYEEFEERIAVLEEKVRKLEKALAAK